MKELKVNNWRVMGMGPGFVVYFDPRYEVIKIFEREVDPVRPARYTSGVTDSVSAQQGQGQELDPDKSGPPQRALPY